MSWDRRKNCVGSYARRELLIYIQFGVNAPIQERQEKHLPTFQMQGFVK